ncbi:MAG TPA: response regulator transcription factor [Polyangiaceae bacterium]|jgi:two-component system KDP operon response regulator KdpE|nr:response regulator transcription factor [Polyangiaceae bacterium]
MTSVLPRILIVEDEAHMRRFLRTTLTHNGYEVAEAVDGMQALGQVAWQEPNLILLDLGLPDVDGMSVVARVRGQSGVPIIVISARDAERAKVEALDLGANDYVTKPFGADELLARIRVALRAGARPAEVAPTTVLTVDELQIDFTARTVSVAGADVYLTRTEYEMLEVLARADGQVVRHQELLRAVWGKDSVNQVEYLRTFMRQLRYKLEREPSQPRYLLTVSGVGYRLRRDSPPPPRTRARR